MESIVPNRYDSSECCSHETLGTCLVQLHWIPAGEKVTKRDLAHCFDCHVIIAHPEGNESERKRRLVMYCSGCQGNIKMFRELAGADIHFEDVEVLPPSAGEQRQVGVVTFTIPYFPRDVLADRIATTFGRPVEFFESDR